MNMSPEAEEVAVIVEEFIKQFDRQETWLFEYKSKLYFSSGSPCPTAPDKEELHKNAALLFLIYSELSEIMPVDMVKCVGRRAYISYSGMPVKILSDNIMIEQRRDPSTREVIEDHQRYRCDYYPFTSDLMGLATQIRQESEEQIKDAIDELMHRRTRREARQALRDKKKEDDRPKVTREQIRTAIIETLGDEPVTLDKLRRLVADHIEIAKTIADVPITQLKYAITQLINAEEIREIGSEKYIRETYEAMFPPTPLAGMEQIMPKDWRVEFARQLQYGPPTGPDEWRYGTEYGAVRCLLMNKPTGPYLKLKKLSAYINHPIADQYYAIPMHYDLEQIIAKLLVDHTITRADDLTAVVITEDAFIMDFNMIGVQMNLLVRKSNTLVPGEYAPSEPNQGRILMYVNALTNGKGIEDVALETPPTPILDRERVIPKSTEQLTLFSYF